MFHFFRLLFLLCEVRRPLAVLVIVSVSTAGIGKANDRKEYVPYANIERGTDGVNAVTVEIRNEAEGPIRCSASLAHWYSTHVGQAASGGTLQFTLWHDPQTGAYNLMNDLQDRMPVEAIWCGHLARTHETRSAIHLEYRAGQSPAGVRQICTGRMDSRLICRDVGHRTSE